MVCHLSGLCIYAGIPNPIGPLVVWLIKGKEHPFVDDQGKEALNFQISIMIYAFISAILIFLAIGLILLPLLALAHLILTIVGAVHARDGKAYRYPMTIRFIR